MMWHACNLTVINVTYTICHKVPFHNDAEALITYNKYNRWSDGLEETGLPEEYASDPCTAVLAITWACDTPQ